MITDIKGLKKLPKLRLISIANTPVKLRDVQDFKKALDVDIIYYKN